MSDYLNGRNAVPDKRFKVAGEPPAWLSEKEAAASLGFSVSTLRRWRHKNVGPSYFHFGKILRYSRRALDEFLEKNTVSAA